MTLLRRVAVASVGLLLLAACGDDSETAAPRLLSGYETDPAPVVADVTLPDASQNGDDFRMVAGDGRLLIVYFGYTSCPDVCPTTLAEVKKAFKQLGAKADLVDVAMVTIDPDRDTDDVITGYVQSFLPGSHALRSTDPEQLKAAADAFGAAFSVTTLDDGEIEVSHSASMYVVDSTGTVVLAWPFGIPADGIATDLEILFDR
ncbi:MAG: SCO family protein [Actinomycetota bacterium]|nr:SCO family protein [Actinomycetota bacterium]